MQVLAPDFLKALTVDLATDFSNSLKSGELTIEVEPLDIYKFLEKNRKTISKLAKDAGSPYDVEIKESKDIIMYNITELIGKDGISIDAILEDGDLKDNIDDYLEDASKILSDTTLYLAWGVVGVLVLLLFIINLGYFGSFFASCGIPAFIIGLIYFLIALAIPPLLNIIDLPFGELEAFIDFLAGFFAAIIMDISSIVLIVGLALIILAIVINAITRKIRAKAQ
jgi:hypothetical protein